ncbi:hypothetical protein AB4Y45_32760 [Paraburkholderia sp. EG287A]|uniref:hypothetical protein n=1 Tax=Paraburkholderia sp. EG287A TaxID=3237012 RepID=UPI0034D15EE1
MTTTDTNAPAEAPKFDKEWALVLSLCRCGVASGSKAVEHQVSRLAEFYGDSPKGAALREMLERKGGWSGRLVPSGATQPKPVARVVETFRYGPRGRENVRKHLRWLGNSLETLADGTELYAVTPEQPAHYENPNHPKE